MIDKPIMDVLNNYRFKACLCYCDTLGEFPDDIECEVVGHKRDCPYNRKRGEFCESVTDYIDGRNIETLGEYPRDEYGYIKEK